MCFDQNFWVFSLAEQYFSGSSCVQPSHFLIVNFLPASDSVWEVWHQTDTIPNKYRLCSEKCPSTLWMPRVQEARTQGDRKIPQNKTSNKLGRISLIFQFCFLPQSRQNFSKDKLTHILLSAFFYKANNSI